MKKTHKCLLLVYFFEIIMKPFTLGFVIFLSASLRYANSWEIQPAIDCWEECFHEGDIADEEAYKTFLSLAHFVKMHRMSRNVNGTHFVLDSSLEEKYDVDLFRYLKDVIRLLTMTVPSGQFFNPSSLAQFNQDFAW